MILQRRVSVELRYVVVIWNSVNASVLFFGLPLVLLAQSPFVFL